MVNPTIPVTPLARSRKGLLGRFAGYEWFCPIFGSRLRSPSRQESWAVIPASWEVRCGARCTPCRPIPRTVCSPNRSDLYGAQKKPEGIPAVHPSRHVFLPDLQARIWSGSIQAHRRHQIFVADPGTLRVATATIHMLGW